MFRSSNLSFSIVILLIAVIITLTAAQTTTTTTTPSPPSSDSYNCSSNSASCDECVHHSIHCYYCFKTKRCAVYPFNTLKPIPVDCGDSLSDMAWQTCIPLNVLTIIFGTLGGMLALIIIGFLIWCCLVRPCVRRCRERDSAKWEMNRLRLSEMQTQRRREREQKRDEIRAKYGIDGPKYDKF